MKQLTLAIDLNGKTVPDSRRASSLGKFIFNLVSTIHDTFGYAETIQALFNDLRDSDVLGEHKDLLAETLIDTRRRNLVPLRTVAERILEDDRLSLRIEDHIIGEIVGIDDELESEAK